MTLPRLTEVGDTATLTVTAYKFVDVPAGPAVEFTFEGHDDVLVIGRMAVDGNLLRMEYAVGEGKEIQPDYERMKEGPLVFSRTAPTRRGAVHPLWRIERPEVVGVRVQTNHAPTPTADKRAAVRQRYDEEALRILIELVPKLAELASARGITLAVNFDVNAAAASIVIEQGKRGAA